MIQEIDNNLYICNNVAEHCPCGKIILILELILRGKWKKYKLRRGICDCGRIFIREFSLNPNEQIK